MSAVLPELGSKISLISKADIRYEGRLYTVDPQECTIALSSVRSFGTEDRDTQFQIAPQSQIYDYILFRGSDIKDIRVVNSNLPHPNDPAIMQVQLPNGQHLMPHFPMPNMSAPPQPSHGPQHAISSVYGNPFGGIGSNNTTGAVLSGGANSSGNTGSSGAPNQTMPQPGGTGLPAGPPFIMDMLAGASRSTTPISLLSRKSPSADMATQVNPQQVNQQQQQQQQQQAGASQQQHHQQQPHHVNHHQQQQLNNAGTSNMSSRDAGHKRQQQNHHMPRGGNQHRVNNNDYHHQQQQQVRDRRDSARNNNLIDNNHINNNKQQSHDVNNGRGGPNSYNNNNNYQRGGNNQGRGWTMHRGQNNANAIIRNRVATGRNAGPGRMQNPNYRQITGNIGTGPGGASGVGSNQNKMRNPKNTIKFEQDFDFEQANNKFEELRSQLSKLKVGEDAKTEQLNGELDKKDDSGNETGAGEQEHEDEEVSVGYDKTKSFFDNISCEAAQDRSKNKKNDWRQERKLNSETFGVSSTRRGGYRGRGGQFYNRAVGNYINAGNAIGNNGGGYNRTYRNTNNNYRNRNMRMGGGTGNSRDGMHTNNHNAATTAANNANNNNNNNNAVSSNSNGTNDNKTSTDTSVNTTQATSGVDTTVSLTTTNLLKQLNLTATTSSVSSPTTTLSATNAASGTPAASVATPTSAKNLGSSAAATDVSKGATPKPQQDGKSPAVNNNATAQPTAATAVAASQ